MFYYNFSNEFFRIFSTKNEALNDNKNIIDIINLKNLNIEKDIFDLGKRKEGYCIKINNKYPIKEKFNLEINKN